MVPPSLPSLPPSRSPLPPTHLPGNFPRPYALNTAQPNCDPSSGSNSLERLRGYALRCFLCMGEGGTNARHTSKEGDHPFLCPKRAPSQEPKPALLSTHACLPHRTCLPLSLYTSRQTQAAGSTQPSNAWSRGGWRSSLNLIRMLSSLTHPPPRNPTHTNPTHTGRRVGPQHHVPPRCVGGPG